MKKQILFIVLTLGLMVGFSASAIAEVDLYGSIRMETYYLSNEQGAVSGVTEDDSDLLWQLQKNSRIGAKFTAGEISGRYELAVKGANDSNSVSTRHLYGEYNFGAGSLLIGQTYTPINIYYSNQCGFDDDGLYRAGEMDAGRAPMIQLTYGTFNVALVTPYSGGTSAIANETLDVTVPKFEANYSLPVEMFTIDFMGGYQTYEDGPDDITSFALGVGTRIDLSPVYVNLKYWYGQNSGNYADGFGGEEGAVTALNMYDPITDEDADTHGFIGVVGFRASEKVNLEGGIGYVKHERGALDDDSYEYYVQAEIDITKNFKIVPEIGGTDFDDTPSGTDAGGDFYAGMKWQIDL